MSSVTFFSYIRRASLSSSHRPPFLSFQLAFGEQKLDRKLRVVERPIAFIRGAMTKPPTLKVILCPLFRRGFISAVSPPVAVESFRAPLITNCRFSHRQFHHVSYGADGDQIALLLQNGRAHRPPSRAKAI
jgi:hypothetical protein